MMTVVTRDTPTTLRGKLVATMPGVYWQVVAQETAGVGYTRLHLVPVDGHEIPVGTPVESVVYVIDPPEQQPPA